jgi:hypothetical protein
MKSNAISAKDALYNKVCGMLQTANAKFPDSFSREEIKRQTMILVDALWYLNGHFDKISDRTAHLQNIVPIPERY